MCFRVFVFFVLLFIIAPASAHAQTSGMCTCTPTIQTTLCQGGSVRPLPEVITIPGQIIPRNFTNVLANCTLPGSQPSVNQLQSIIEAFNATPISVTDAATCNQAGRPQTVNVGTLSSVTLNFTCAFTASASVGSPAGAGSTVAPSGPTVVKLANPLGEGRTDLRAIIGEVIQKILTVLGSITLLVFIAGGVMWLTSGGSEEKVAKGSKTMLYAAIGIFVIFAAYAILNTAIKTLTGTGG